MKLLYIHHRDLLSHEANNIQVANMCKAFAKSGYHTTLLIPHSINSTEEIEKIRVLHELTSEDIDIISYQYINLKSAFLSTILSYLLSIPDSLKKNTRNYDLIFTRHITSYLFFRKKANKIIFEIHNSYFLKNKLLESILMHLLNNGKYLSKTLIVCISENLSNFWKEKLLGFKIISSHDGFDELLFLHKLARQDARKSIGWPQEGKIVSYVGSLWPDREIEKIIDLAESCPEYRFYVIGGPERFIPEYQNMLVARQIHNLVFTGKVPYQQVPLYLYASDVLLALWSDKVPTINYCSPLKIFEYMAAGNIILAHDYPTIREVIYENKTGFLIRPNDQGALKNKLIELLTNLPAKKRSQLEKSSREIAYSKYTWTKRIKFILSNIE